MEFNKEKILEQIIESRSQRIAELEKDRRFTAAVAAMQGLCANSMVVKDVWYEESIAEIAIARADALLKELDRTKEQGE